MGQLADFLKKQLDQRVSLATKRINDEFARKITSTDFASKYSGLAKQGDFAPLAGGNYKGRGLSIPQAIAREMTSLRGQNISKVGTVTTIGFGLKPFLVQLSPQILWYEYGYIRGQSNKGDEALAFLPGWFKINSKNKVKSSRWTWVAIPGLGRQDEGALFPGDSGFVKLAKATGIDTQPSGPIPPVAMYRRTLLAILPRLQQIVRGI
jgi:hypothetical protein